MLLITIAVGGFLSALLARAMIRMDNESENL